MRDDNLKTKKKKIVKNLDKVIHDFIPELKNLMFNHEFKENIIDEVVANIDQQKLKLFFALPSPFLAEYVCKNSSQILSQFKDDKDSE